MRGTGIENNTLINALSETATKIRKAKFRMTACIETEAFEMWRAKYYRGYRQNRYFQKKIKENIFLLTEELDRLDKFEIRFMEFGKYMSTRKDTIAGRKVFDEAIRLLKKLEDKFPNMD